MALLELSDITKVFRSPEGEAQTILDIPAFELDAGRQLAIAGTSGSGKTTFLNVIAGLLTPTSGTVKFEGADVSRYGEARRDAWRAQELGYVFQTFNLLGGYTALENVVVGMMFGPGADRDFARGLLERRGLGDRLNHRPKQLSIGQQQRVAVARALANRPRLVLADEPTGNLDPRFALEALTLLRELCRDQDAALLCVSHDPRVLDDFDDRLDFEELNRAMRAEGAEA
ncbi:MAG: ABC transporter ATP-binding protein [Planctomycetota bacterium]